MEYTWSRAFADGREAALMGGSAERLLDACQRLSSAGAKTASGLVEAPLLGAPEYDALVSTTLAACFPAAWWPIPR